MPHQILFFIFATVCFLGALNLLVQRHPIASALSLIVVMASLAVLYMLLGAEFLAAIQVIVYAGAIMVLFLFVIMLLNAGEEEHTTGNRVAALFGYPALTLIAAMLFYVITRQPAGGAAAPTAYVGGFMVTTQQIAVRLFRDFLLPFEVTSILILVAIMGAVVLARRSD